MVATCQSFQLPLLGMLLGPQGCDDRGLPRVCGVGMQDQKLCCLTFSLSPTGLLAGSQPRPDRSSNPTFAGLPQAVMTGSGQGTLIQIATHSYSSEPRG